MKLFTATLFGVAVALLSFGLLHAQEEPDAPDQRSDHQRLEERVDKLEEEVARLSKDLTDVTESVVNHNKEISSLEKCLAEKERERAGGREQPEPQSPEQSSRSATFVLQNASAARLGAPLRTLFPPKVGEEDAVRILINERDNSIKVIAPHRQIDANKSLLNAADCSTETNKIKIVRLENAQAQELAIVIENLFQPRRPGEALRIAVDTRTNSIILRTSPQQLKEIEAVIQRLDESEIKPPAEVEVEEAIDEVVQEAVDESP